MRFFHLLKRTQGTFNRRFFSSEQTTPKLTVWQKVKAGVKRDAMGIINVVALFMLVSLATQFRKLSQDRKEINAKITTFKRRWDRFELALTSDEYVDVCPFFYVKKKNTLLLTTIDY